MSDEYERRIRIALEDMDRTPTEIALHARLDQRGVREAIWRMIDRGEIKLTIDRRLALSPAPQPATTQNVIAAIKAAGGKMTPAELNERFGAPVLTLVRYLVDQGVLCPDLEWNVCLVRP